LPPSSGFPGTTARPTGRSAKARQVLIADPGRSLSGSARPPPRGWQEARGQFRRPEAGARRQHGGAGNPSPLEVQAHWRGRRRGGGHRPAHLQARAGSRPYPRHVAREAGHILAPSLHDSEKRARADFIRTLRHDAEIAARSIKSRIAAVVAARPRQTWA